MVIVWNLKAKQELKKVYDFILKDSYQNALKVRQEIIDAVMSLTEYPINTNLISTRLITTEHGGFLKYTITEFLIELKKTRFESFP